MWLRKKILLLILMPVFAVGLAFSGMVAYYLTPPLLSLLKGHQEAELRIASYLGMAVCETNVNYLLDLRLEDDPEMNTSLRKDSLEEIKRISNRFPSIHMVILDGQGSLVDSSLDLRGKGIRNPSLPKGDSQVMDQDIWGEAVRIHSRYFPYWDWHLVSLIPKKDYRAPLAKAQQIVYLGTFGVFATVLITLLMVFYSFVNRPLKRLIRATEGVAAGTYQKVETGSRDEIGQLARAFNEMVDSLKKKSDDVDQLVQALRLSENRFRTAFQTSPDAMAISRLQDSFIVDVNHEYVSLFGFPREELLGRTALELGVWLTRELRNEFADLLNRDGFIRNREVQFRRKDTTLITVLLSATLMTLPEGMSVFWVFKDIGELKEAEQTLRESEERYRILTDQSLTGIYIHQKGAFVYVNARLAQMFGCTQQEMIGRAFTDFVHPDDRDMVKRRAIARFKGLPEPTNYGFRGLRKDGSTVWGEVLATVVEYRGQAANMGNVVDITQRIQAEEALRESEEKYRLLVKNATDAIFIAQDGVIKFPNPITLTMVDYTEEELRQIPFIDLIHPEDRDMVLDRYQRRLKGEAVPRSYSFRILHRSGEVRWVQLNVVRITWEGRPAILNFLRDITEHKALEEQLQQAQKMKAIGTLAGGIAHDFNNLLMGIQGNASLMMLDIPRGHRHHERLKHIEEYVQRGSDLTRQLLGFARGGKYEVRPANINEVVRKSAEMFGRTKKEIVILSQFQHDLWTVEVDQGQIEQVLLNLCVNAWQAMPGGGELHIQTLNEVLDEAFVGPHGMAPGNYVKISIRDTGVGMEPEVQERLFEPFFTTKDMGRGTGLGLASAYGIIKNHGGIILVESEKGKGSTFIIYLPALASEPTQKEGEDRGHGLWAKGSETILVVDDEDMIRDVATQMLEAMGYRVLTAQSGEEALEILSGAQKSGEDAASGPSHPDLVLLDMIMPGMGGEKTYQRIRAMAPDLKILLSSGYSIDTHSQRILDQGCNGFIQKPFSLEELSQKIREILGQ